MKKRLYNVIWADDKTSVYNTQGEDNELVDILNLKGIRIIDTARNAEELAEKLEKRLSWVDAVITDANYLSLGDVPKYESQLSGFYDTAKLFKSLGKSGNKIPFLVWSGRSIGFIEERCIEDGYQKLEFLEYIKENDLYFNKTDSELDYLFDKLIMEVDRINTPEHQIRVRYYDAFEAASLIDGAEDELLKCLLLDFNHEALPDVVKDRFNAIRRVFEKMYTECKKSGLLPRMPLNSIPKLLSKEAYPFELIEGEHPMHRALIEAFSYFLSVVQDGSHEDGDLNLGVLDYTQMSHSQNLLQSAVNIMMDLLIWYRWASKEYEGRKFWKGNYKADGYVEQIIKPKFPGGHYFFISGMYTFEQNDTNPAEVGDFIGVKNWEEDRKNPGRRFVKAREYDIIEKNKQQ
jgi:hypothetical protein